MSSSYQYPLSKTSFDNFKTAPENSESDWRNFYIARFVLTVFAKNLKATF